MKAFVKALFGWLADPVNAAILSWDANGKTFRVKNPEQFMEDLYRQRFKAARYNSFNRQLNIYGFRCREEAFVHPSFQRDFVDYDRILKRKGGSEALTTKEPSKAAASKAAASKAARQRSPDPFEFDHLYLFSTAGLVDLMLGLDL